MMDTEQDNGLSGTSVRPKPQLVGKMLSSSTPNRALGKRAGDITPRDMNQRQSRIFPDAGETTGSRSRLSKSGIAPCVSSENIVEIPRKSQTCEITPGAIPKIKTSKAVILENMTDNIKTDGMTENGETYMDQAPIRRAPKMEPLYNTTLKPKADDDVSTSTERRYSNVLEQFMRRNGLATPASAAAAAAAAAAADGGCSVLSRQADQAAPNDPSYVSMGGDDLDPSCSTPGAAQEDHTTVSTPPVTGGAATLASFGSPVHTSAGSERRHLSSHASSAVISYKLKSLFTPGRSPGSPTVLGKVDDTGSLELLGCLETSKKQRGNLKATPPQNLHKGRQNESHESPLNTPKQAANYENGSKKSTTRGNSKALPSTSGREIELDVESSDVDTSTEIESRRFHSPFTETSYESSPEARPVRMSHQNFRRRGFLSIMDSSVSMKTSSDQKTLIAVVFIVVGGLMIAASMVLLLVIIV